MASVTRSAKAPVTAGDLDTAWRSTALRLGFSRVRVEVLRHHPHPLSRRRFERTAAAAGTRVLRFHALRHGAGSLVARQADARWVQGFLGHSKINHH